MSHLDLVRTIEVSPSPEASVTTESRAVYGTTGWCCVCTLGPTTHRGPQIERIFLRDFSGNISRAGNGNKTYSDLQPGVYIAQSVYRSHVVTLTAFVVSADGAIEVLATDQNSPFGPKGNESTLAAAQRLAKMAGRDLAAEKAAAEAELAEKSVGLAEPNSPQKQKLFEPRKTGSTLSRFDAWSFEFCLPVKGIQTPSWQHWVRFV